MPTIERNGDTARGYAALLDYAAMGPGRSLEKLARVYQSSTESTPTQNLRSLKEWSTKHDWQARVASYDRAIAQEAELARAAVRAERRKELEERDWEQGGLLRQRAAELLAELPKFLRRTETVTTVDEDGEEQRLRIITLAMNATPTQIAALVKVGSEVQRLSVGEATEIIDHRIERELERALDRLRDNLDEATYARVCAILAGDAG